MVVVLASMLLLKRFNIKFTTDMIGISMAAWLAASVTVLAYKIGGNTVSGALIIFAFALVFGFVGGAFVPTALLPENLKVFSDFSPVRVMGSALSSVFVDKSYINDIKMWISMSVFAELLIIIHKPE
jgi:hypothetical protein